MNKIERVARAICRPVCRNEAHPCDKESDGTCKPDKCRDWRLYEDSARAAIEAMREHHGEAEAALLHLGG